MTAPPPARVWLEAAVVALLGTAMPFQQQRLALMENASAAADAAISQVQAAAVATHAQRNHRWVFEEHQQIGHHTSAALLDEPPLQCKGITVAHYAELMDQQLTHETTPGFIFARPCRKNETRFLIPESDRIPRYAS